MELCELAEQEIIYQILLFKFLEAVEKEDAQNVAILQPAFDIAANQLKRLPIIGSHVTIDWCVWMIDFFPIASTWNTSTNFSSARNNN